MKPVALISLLTALILALGVNPASAQEVATAEIAVEAPAAARAGWIVRDADHIAGVKIASQIQNPVKVDYDQILRRTDEHKTIVREGISKSDPRYGALIREANRKISAAAERYMNQSGYDSVWKEISHRDGRTIATATQEVINQL